MIGASSLTMKAKTSGAFSAEIKYSNALHFRLIRDQIMDERQKWMNFKALFHLQIYFGWQKNANTLMNVCDARINRNQKKINIRTSMNVVESWMKSDEREKHVGKI